jgi:uncharacterized protein (TIGR02246 family)
MNDNHTDRSERRRAVLERFSAAWAAGDVDALLSLMNDDPTYRGSTGPLPGTEARGREAVAAAFERMVGMNRGKPTAAAPEPLRCHFFGDQALVYWQLVLPGANGGVPVDGLDLMSFDAEDRITCKDAYRKAFT